MQGGSFPTVQRMEQGLATGWNIQSSVYGKLYAVMYMYVFRSCRQAVL